jgi:hypothetical protein
VIGIVDYPPTFEHGVVNLEPVAGFSFIRGDSNGDGALSVADGVYTLNYMFASGPNECTSAHDANDDGAVNVADPVYNLNYQFASGPILPPPFPGCGLDPTPDGLNCTGLTACP